MAVPPTVLILLEEMLALSDQFETLSRRVARMRPDLQRVMEDERARERDEPPALPTRSRAARATSIRRR